MSQNYPVIEPFKKEDVRWKKDSIDFLSICFLFQLKGRIN